MRRTLSVIWQDIRTGQNLDIYITIAIAIAVAILGTIGGANQTVISSAILATLALVSIGTLRNRREDEVIKNTLVKIETTDRLAERFFKRGYDPSDFRERIRNSRKAFFWGITFATSVQVLDYAIEQGMKSGLEVRFLLVKPDSSASIKMAAFRHRHLDEERENSSLRGALSRLADIASTASNSPGRLDVRVVDYLPSWTTIATDPHLSSGYMSVRLSTFRVPDEERPTFELTAKADTEWFRFFVDQFETIWKESELVNLDEHRKKIGSEN